MGCSCCWLSGGNLWLGQPTMTYPTYPVVGVAGTRSAAPKPALHCIACSLRNFDYGMQQGPRQLTGCLQSLDWPFCFLSGSPLHLSHDLLDCLLGRLTAVFWRYIGIWAHVLMPLQPHFKFKFPHWNCLGIFFRGEPNW